MAMDKNDLDIFRSKNSMDIWLFSDVLNYPCPLPLRPVAPSLVPAHDEILLAMRYKVLNSVLLFSYC